MPKGERIDWDKYNEFIKENYLKFGRVECARQLSLKVDAVSRQANKLGLKTFSRTPWTKARCLFLRKFYPTKGAPFCARILKISVFATNKQAQKLGIKRKPKNVHVSSQGYLIKSKMVGRVETKQLLHRLLVEEYLGRQLKSSEIVHHIDRNKLNNELSNLALVSRSEHVLIHKVELYEAQWGDIGYLHLTSAEKEKLKEINVSVLVRYPQ